MCGVKVRARGGKFSRVGSTTAGKAKSKNSGSPRDELRVTVTKNRGALSRSLGTLWEATSCCWSAGKSREENRRRTGAFPAEIDDVREEQTTASSTTTTTFDRVSSSPSSSSLEGVPQPPTTTTPLPIFSTYCGKCVCVWRRVRKTYPHPTHKGARKKKENSR